MIAIDFLLFLPHFHINRNGTTPTGWTGFVDQLHLAFRAFQEVMDVLFDRLSPLQRLKQGKCVLLSGSTFHPSNGVLVVLPPLRFNY